VYGLDQSLEEIEGNDWGDPPSDATRLISTVNRLRRRAIGSLDTEDLRILLGQQVGTEILVPLAVERLEEDPLAEGDFYPGDLLAAVVRLPGDYWRSHPELMERVRGVIAAVPPGAADEDLLGDIASFGASIH
jgi:hypothetical protein